MKIKERPEFASKKKPLAFSPETSLETALNEMAEKRYGSVIVVNDNNNVMGIVTERDLMVKVLHKDLKPSKTQLKDIMTTEVKIAHDDDNVIDWIQVMSNERFRHLPIVNENDELVSVMSQGDFVAYTWPELLSDMKDKTKTTVGRFYEVFLILVAVLGYTLAVNMFV